MRILMTNNTLAERAGSELWVRDVALALKKMGHEPVAFSMNLGEVAEELRAGGVTVVSSLAQVHGPFDLIHGHHRIETTLAAMAFPKLPVISFCHGPKIWHESPCVMPNVVSYVAVDDACKQRLINEGIDEKRITRLLNFADTERFLPRPPLPPKPRRALVFSNTAREEGHVKVIREACAQLDVEVTVRGRESGQRASKPEEELAQYDLVFAKARAAIEAMAVGCAVVQCDHFGAGWMINSARFDELRALNFGYLSMKQPITADHLVSQIAFYDAADAAAVSRRIRNEASLQGFMPQLLEHYATVAAVEIPTFDPWDRGAAFIGEIAQFAKDGIEMSKRREAVMIESAALEERIALLKENHAILKEQCTALKEQCTALKEQCTALKEQRTALKEQSKELKDKIKAQKSELNAAKKKSRWKFWK